MANPVKELLAEHRSCGLEPEMDSKLHFELLPDNEGKDVYNITAPFEWKGQVWLLGRVEARDSEYAQIGFFQPVPESDRHWREVEVQHLPMQDPFFSLLEDEIVVGGVEVVKKEDGSGLSYRTAFFRGADLSSLERFAVGPWGMKDLRLKKLPDGRVLLLTRPQGDPGGRGTIGWTLLPELSALAVDAIDGATLLTDQFLEEEWGGGNEIHVLSGSRVGVLAHIARFDDEGNRHYYASAFELDYETGATTPMRIIAERKDFAPGPSKRPDLEDVLFSGGLLRESSESATIYCGTADCEVHCRKLEDPFRESEETDHHGGHRP